MYKEGKSVLLVSAGCFLRYGVRNEIGSTALWLLNVQYMGKIFGNSCQVITSKFKISIRFHSALKIVTECNYKDN